MASAAARTGTRVKAGDPVIEFDRSTVLRTLGEKDSELKRAESEIDRIQAQRKIAEQELVTNVHKARFDLERAKLDASAKDLLSRVEYEQDAIHVTQALVVLVNKLTLRAPFHASLPGLTVVYGACG